MNNKFYSNQELERNYCSLFHSLMRVGLVAIVLLTTACGGGGGGSEPAAATDQQATADEKAITDANGAPDATIVADATATPPPGSIVKFHNVDGCITCHDFTEAGSNLKFVRETINTPNSGPKAVVFTALTGPNSLADGDEIYNGPCEVCHTQNGHHNNDGHDLTNHLDGERCTQCHKHDDEFAPPHKQSHQTHVLENQAKGPFIECTDCHLNPLVDPLVFADLQPLATTTVCDTCHSPGGNYPNSNDLFDPAIGAKANFTTGGIYEEDGKTLKPGKERWCATCHDKAAAVIRGVSAPNVVGDEDAATPYGIGYGFYKSGHGLPNSERYPGTQSAGAGRGCTDCHDPLKKHIDGNARTYAADSDYLTYAPESASYQNGYRLNDVPGGYMGKYPMHIPRTGHVFPPGFREDWEFALCFSCHDKNKIFSMTESNFRTDGVGNRHDLHTSGLNGPFGPTTPQFDSDFDGVADSRISCVSCHNVHGSPTPAMVRHGELISTPGTTDKVPSLNLRYTPYTSPILSESTGGTVSKLIAGPGNVAGNGVCNMCHNNTVTYTRTPVAQNAPVRPTNLLPVNATVNVSLTPTLQTSNYQDPDPLATHVATQWQLTTRAGNYSLPIYDTEELSDLTQHTLGITLLDDTRYYWRARYKNSEGIWSGYSLESSFTTAGGTGGKINLTPTSLVSTDYFSVTGGTWDTALDFDDGDASYALMCCTAGFYGFTVDMDDPAGLTGSETINSIKITIAARYLDGPWPGAVPYAGGITVSYKTGANQEQVISATTDISGEYNVLVSSDIVADSDGGDWDIADLENLQIYLHRSVFGPPQIRVTHISVEVDYSM